MRAVDADSIDSLCRDGIVSTSIQFILDEFDPTGVTMSAADTAFRGGLGRRALLALADGYAAESAEGGDY